MITYNCNRCQDTKKVSVVNHIDLSPVESFVDCPECCFCECKDKTGRLCGDKINRCDYCGKIVHVAGTDLLIKAVKEGKIDSINIPKDCEHICTRCNKITYLSIEEYMKIEVSSNPQDHRCEDCNKFLKWEVKMIEGIKRRTEMDNFNKKLKESKEADFFWCECSPPVGKGKICESCGGGINKTSKLQKWVKLESSDNIVTMTSSINPTSSNKPPLKPAHLKGTLVNNNEQIAKQDWDKMSPQFVATLILSGMRYIKDGESLNSQSIQNKILKGSNYMKINNVELEEINIPWNNGEKDSSLIEITLKFKKDDVSAEDLGKIMKSSVFKSVSFEISKLSI